MNVEQLEAFIYTTHFKSTNKAAKALYISQPTVTSRIQAIEKELGQLLFERQGKSLVLNQYGHEFLKYAQQIIQIYRECKEQLQKDLSSQDVKLGVNMIASNYLLPKILPKWSLENSPGELHVQSMTNEELVVKVLNKELDFAIMRESDSLHLHQQLVLENKIKLVVYPGHPFVLKQAIAYSDFVEEPLVVFECGAFDWKMLYAFFEANNVDINVKYQVNNFEVAKSFIKNKKCIGFLPELCFQKEVNNQELIVVDIPNFPVLAQPLFLAALKGHTDHHFYEMMLQSFKLQ